MLTILISGLLISSYNTLALGKAPKHIDTAAADTARMLKTGPEPVLAQAFEAIEKNNLDLALQHVELLVKTYPNFRLAHLVKGDILLARARPLRSFGDGGDADAGRKAATGEKLADLREEAIVRLKSYRTKPPADFVPRYLMQLRADQKHAVVVDTQKSRLYLYQNDNGTPRFVADYYISQGKLGAEKTREGDKKTPIGVYHVTSSLSPKKLGDFYGTGAYPINYPNDWDRKQGRNGHGIWLHGTPSDTFSRPPKASEGCVVLSNRDLDALAKNLDIGLTPVIISNSVEWLSLDDWQAERKSLQKAIEEWRQDWESRDTDRYARHYSSRFNSDGQNYRSWIEQKRGVNMGKTWIKVATGNISMFRNPGKEQHVVVTFEQDYRSNNLSNLMKKRQYWIKEGSHWKIVAEGEA